jgi:hypothetical protein
MYSVYTSNQQVSMETVEAGMKQKNFKIFLDEQVMNPRTKGLMLNSFLIKPIQR